MNCSESVVLLMSKRPNNLFERKRPISKKTTYFWFTVSPTVMALVNLSTTLGLEKKYVDLIYIHAKYHKTDLTVLDLPPELK